jgi:hypothetical protein
MSQDFRKRFDALQLQAEHDLARALLEEPSPRQHRDTLSSVSDLEEDSKVTAALVEGAVKGALTATSGRLPPGSVEIDTPAGVRVRGAVWSIVLIAFVVAALIAALRLIHPH